MSTSLPRQPGTYILGLQLADTRSIQIGKLGKFTFNSGFYYYIGSAFGPGGLNARCGHHIKISDRPRWHIDYLRKNCDLKHILFSIDKRQLEHQWADQLSQTDDTHIPLPGFGSSDCQCNSHLFFSNNNLMNLSDSIRSTLTGSPDILDLD